MKPIRRSTTLPAVALLLPGLLAGCGGGGPDGEAVRGTVSFTFRWPAEVQGRLITPATDEILVRCTHPDYAAQVVAAKRAEVGADGALRRTVALPAGIWRFQAFGFTNLGALEVYGSTEARVLPEARISVGLAPERPQRSAALSWAMLPDAGSVVFYADQGDARRLLLQSLSSPPGPPDALQAAADPVLTWTLTAVPTDGGKDWLTLSSAAVTGTRAEVPIHIDRARLPFLINVAILRIDAGPGGMRELAIVVTNSDAPAVAIPDPGLVGTWRLRQVTRNGGAMPAGTQRLSIAGDQTWRRDDLDTGAYRSGVLQVPAVQVGMIPGTYQLLVLAADRAASIGEVKLGTYTVTATELALTEVNAGDEWVERFGRE